MNDKKEIEQLRGFTAGSGCGGHSADYGNFKSERL